MEDGWFKVSWKIKHSPGCASAVAMGVWVHLLARVSRRDRVLRNGLTLLTGEAQISEVAFAADLDVSRKVMRRLLEKWVELGMIRIIKRDRNGTTLSVSQWRTYQDSQNQKGQQRNSKETATEQQRNSNEHQTEKGKKERRKEGKIDGASPNARFVPPTFDEVAAYCLERSNGIDPQLFVDFYEANGWVQSRGKPIKSWRAAVRTWERNGFNQGGGSRPAYAPPKTKTQLANERFEARYPDGGYGDGSMGGQHDLRGFGPPGGGSLPRSVHAVPIRPLGLPSYPSGPGSLAETAGLPNDGSRASPTGGQLRQDAG